MGGVGTGKTFFFRALGDVLAANGKARPTIYPMMDTVGRKVADDNGIPRQEAAANCLAFGFTWWKPIKYHWE